MAKPRILMRKTFGLLSRIHILKRPRQWAYTYSSPSLGLNWRFGLTRFTEPADRNRRILRGIGAVQAKPRDGSTTPSLDDTSSSAVVLFAKEGKNHCIFAVCAYIDCASPRVATLEDVLIVFGSHAFFRSRPLPHSFLSCCVGLCAWPTLPASRDKHLAEK
jgi:hypothetical protein